MMVALPSRRTSCRRWFRFGTSRPQAARVAEALDRIVERDLELLRALPLDRRGAHADRLAAIVMLAQAYRYFARGWINRRELRRRAQAALTAATVAVS
jgi:hypothetical protein